MSFVVRAREVEKSKLAEVFDRCSVIRSRGLNPTLLRVWEFAQVDILAPNFYRGDIVRRHETASFISSGVVGLLRPVGAIFGSCRYSKILSTIIQRVSVNVVNILICFENLAVHKDSSTGVVISDRAVLIPFLKEHCAPVELGKVFVIACADQSILPSCKRNNAIRWVKRLDNIMSWHGAFHKEPSFLVRLSAALTDCITLEAA